MFTVPQAAIPDGPTTAAINTARNKGARVINMSFNEKTLKWNRDEISKALRSAWEHDIVLVAAAGNENFPSCGYPGSDPNTICVGGSTQNDERKTPSAYSAWGSNYGSQLDLMAPSEMIPTTDLLSPEGSDYRNFSETSAATPHVSGVAALILSARPELNAEDVRGLIERSCDKVNPGSYGYAQTTGRPNGTWSSEMGYGRLSASAALWAAMRRR
jgi:subtilisin family serine protease